MPACAALGVTWTSSSSKPGCIAMCRTSPVVNLAFVKHGATLARLPGLRAALGWAGPALRPIRAASPFSTSVRRLLDTPLPSAAAAPPPCLATTPAVPASSAHSRCPDRFMNLQGSVQMTLQACRDPANHATARAPCVRGPSLQLSIDSPASIILALMATLRSRLHICRCRLLPDIILVSGYPNNCLNQKMELSKPDRIEIRSLLLMRNLHE